MSIEEQMKKNVMEFTWQFLASWIKQNMKLGFCIKYILWFITTSNIWNSVTPCNENGYAIFLFLLISNEINLIMFICYLHKMIIFDFNDSQYYIGYILLQFCNQNCCDTHMLKWNSCSYSVKACLIQEESLWKNYIKTSFLFY